MNLRLAALAACTALAFGPIAHAAVPGAFTARYQVSQGGQAIGTATVTLRASGNGQWTLAKSSDGTAGLAALLGASTHETSLFRWRGNVPEAIRYDYRSTIAGKRKQRTLEVNWNANAVAVDEGKGINHYAAVPGMVERNTLPLAIGMALANGAQQISLPVAVRQTVETDNFKVAGDDTVQVPAGSFHAERVERSDAAREFSAWYVPKRYPLPVKMTQREGGDLTLELVSYSQP